MFHDHFSIFLVTAIYKSETRTATRSPWQAIRQFQVTRSLAPFVICTPFNTIFSPSRLRLRVAISIRNHPTKLHTQTQIRIPVCSLSHIPLFPPLPVPANILFLICAQIFKDFWFWSPHVQNCSFFKNISQSSCIFCLILRVGLTVREFYILDCLQFFIIRFSICVIFVRSSLHEEI